MTEEVLKNSKSLKENDDEKENAKILIDTRDQDDYLGAKSIYENRIEREWLTTKEAAQFLGVSENALRIMVHRGQLSAFKLRRRLRFRLKDCRALFHQKGA